MRTEEKTEDKKHNMKKVENNEEKDMTSYWCLGYETAKQTITR
jgi:hypothetical protein